MTVAVRLLVLAVLVWSGWFLTAAFQRWRFEAVCSVACGPFWPVELAEAMRRSMDWQTPLLVAAVPLAVLLGCWMTLRLSTGRFRLP